MTNDMRRSQRLVDKAPVKYGPSPRRQRLRITVTGTLRNFARGGTMPNVYGQAVLNPDDHDAGYEITLVTEDIWRRTNPNPIQQNEVRNIYGGLMYPNGIGYFAITDDLFNSITREHLMYKDEITRIVNEQFKAMHAYNWKSSVAFVNMRYKIEEVNAQGLLRRGRTPREVPMLSVKPLRLPYLKHNVAAISLQDADMKELCVPAALYHWLINQTTDRKGGKRTFMSAAACDKYPNALPRVKDSRGRLAKKVEITPVTVRALLDAIHAANDNDDVGHTVQDVEEFVSLFNCNMVALNREGVVIGEVVDGDKHHPLCFTCAHGHMYWHCDVEDIKSIAESAKQQRRLGSKHYCAQGGAIVPKVAKKTQDSEFCIVTEEEMQTIFESPSELQNTIYLVKGMKDVEELFKEYGWRFGEPWAKVRERRVVRFGVQLDDAQLTIGADPFYEQVILAKRQGVDFDHRALFDACATNNITINPLDGVGNAIRQILRPTREKVTLEMRQVLFDKQDGKCAKCNFVFENCKKGHVDHILALGNGGKDELQNLQILCIECHRMKTESETQIGYSSDKTHSSRVNPYVLDSIMLSPYFQCLEFVESWWPFVGMNVVNRETGDAGVIIQDRADDGTWLVKFGDDPTPMLTCRFQPKTLAELINHPNVPAKFKALAEQFPDRIELRKLDYNGMRRNILYFFQHEWAVFTAFDMPAPFEGTLQEGAIYFVDTEKGFPMHGAGWYRYPLVVKGIDHAWFTFDDIKLQCVPTSTLPGNYFRTRVDKLESAAPDHKALRKTLVNSDVGCMGRKQREVMFSKFSLSAAEAAGKVLLEEDDEGDLKMKTGFDAVVSEYHTLMDGRTIFRTDYTHECAQDMFALPIYEQIKEVEACQAAALAELITKGGGFPLEVATDAILYACVPTNVSHNEQYRDAKQKKKKTVHDEKPDERSAVNAKEVEHLVHCDSGWEWRPFDQPLRHDQVDEATLLQTKLVEGPLPQFFSGPAHSPKVNTSVYQHKLVPDDDGRLVIEDEAALIAMPNIQNEDGTYKQFPHYFWDEDEKKRSMLKWEAPRWNASERFFGRTRAMPQEMPSFMVNFKDVRCDAVDADGNPIDHATWGRDFICECDKSLYLLGPPGAGKSHLTRVMIQAAVEAFGNDAVLIMTPTNVASRNIGGQTLHKFFKHFDTKMEASGAGRVKLQKEMSAYRIVFVDEISMMHTWFWGQLCALQNAYPHLRFILVGDFDQIKPVCDVKEGICYRDNAALHALCGGNKFELTECRRADKAFFETCKDVDAIDVTQFPITSMTFMNLCYYHATRIWVNTKCQAEFIRGKATTPTIAKSRTLHRSQDVTLCVGYPLLSRTNDGEQNKNEFWEVIEINVDDGFKAERIPLEHEQQAEQPVVLIKYANFHHHFEPGFCVTTHAAQGMTLRDKYTVYNWQTMPTELRLVSITRATSAQGVQIDDQDPMKFPKDWGSGRVAGLTFAQAALDTDYCDWVRDITDPNPVFQRFLEFLQDQTTSYDDVRKNVHIIYNEDDDAEEDEFELGVTNAINLQREANARIDDSSMARLRELQKRQREEKAESAPSCEPKRPRGMFLSMQQMRALREV